jgi:hypothetical protein
VTTVDATWASSSKQRRLKVASGSRPYGTRTNWTEQNRLLGTQKIH